MFRNSAVIYIFLGSLWLTSVVCSSVLSDTAIPDPIDGETTEKRPDIDVAGNLLEVAIREFESKGSLAKYAEEKGILPESEIEQLFEDMLPALDTIMNLLKDPNNVFKFIEAKGFERVVSPFLQTYNIQLKTQLLLLTQLLFDVAPTTTSVTIPVTVLDDILDIYEDDESLLIKGRIIDILHSWLPDNPKIQSRVMRLKGLEPFYEQVQKLDSRSIYTLLKLFSKIIKEHKKAREDSQQKTKNDLLNYKLYVRIGLIERLSTERVCHGIFNIFQNLWSYGVQNDKEMFVPVFEILTDIQPYCTNALYGRTKAIEFIKDLLTYVKDNEQDTKGYYVNLGLNTTHFQVVLQTYLDKLGSHLKEEL